MPEPVDRALKPVLFDDIVDSTPPRRSRVSVGSEDLPTDVPFVIDYTIYQLGARG